MTTHQTPFRTLLRRFIVLAAGLTATAVSSAPLPLKVVGAQLFDSEGRPVRLRGVNCASLEWSSDGNGHIFKTIAVAVQEWRANLIPPHGLA